MSFTCCACEFPIGVDGDLEERLCGVCLEAMAYEPPPDTALVATVRKALSSPDTAERLQAWFVATFGEEMGR